MTRGLTWLLDQPALATGLFCSLLFAVGCKKAEYNAPALTVAPTPTDAVGSGAIPPGSSQLFQVPTDIGAKVALAKVATGLARPVFLTFAPGDARKRLFVLLQHEGDIRVIENGVVTPKVFFHIDDLSRGNEQGLLGLAFHPEFATNQKLYVNYTSGDDATHIVEYRLLDPDTVDPKSAREIIRIEQPYSNHNGGNLAFGPDGLLYTGMGDGGSANDPRGNGQNPQALLGKILAFDVNDPKAAASIRHVGSRNPWRFSFDGDALYIGDVGQNKWENVYAIATKPYAKHNFGWNVVEGNHCFPDDKATDCKRDGFTKPIADYSHEQGCSVTGGYVYRGKALPILTGRYFYADYCTGLLRSLKWTPPDMPAGEATGIVREHWEWKPAIDTAGELAEISSFGVDADGELYIVELTGTIFKLVPKT